MSGIVLLPEQQDLLRRLVDAYRRIYPKRIPFLLLGLSDGGDDDQLCHDGLVKGDDRAFPGDVEELARAGLVGIIRREPNHIEFDLRPMAFVYLKQQDGGGPAADRSTVRLSGPGFPQMEITGRVENKRTLIKLAGEEVYLTDAAFRSVVLLADALRQGSDGWVDLDAISRSDNPHESIADLRNQLTLALKPLGIDPKGFVKVESKRVRLTIEVESITIRWDELARHHQGEISSLAKEALQTPPKAGG